MELVAEGLDRLQRVCCEHCAITAIRASLAKGMSTCARDTTLMDTEPHEGQHTASATVGPPAASNVNDEGVTGRERSSR